MCVFFWVGTYKMKKLDYQKEGFDIRKIQDRMYVLKEGNKYEILDESTYDSIMEGRVRF